MHEFPSALAYTEAVRAGEIKITEMLTKTFQTIREKEPKLHCFLSTDEEAAIRRAEQIQTEVEQGRGGILCGVPVAVKDNICVKDMPMTCASRMLAAYTAPYSATVVERMEAAGMIVIGKTNMDEFAMGSTTETSAFGATSNPWNPLFSPGGSSGGSAAAVAAGECMLALGSDTGGSVRQPAAYCGVFGLKPTYGAVSRYGLTAYASSLEQIGILSAEIGDCRALFSVIAGKDSRDANTLFGENKYRQSIMKQRKVALLREASEDTDEDTQMALQNAVKALSDAGIKTEEISVPEIRKAVAAYYIISLAEASSNLARFDGIRYGNEKRREYGFGEEVKRRILWGTFVLEEGYYDKYYQRAMQVRKSLTEMLCHCFHTYDALLTPAAKETAPRLGESLGAPLSMYAKDAPAVLANLAGLPSVSVPMGKDRNGIPVGVLLTGRRWDEEGLMSIAEEIRYDG